MIWKAVLSVGIIIFGIFFVLHNPYRGIEPVKIEEINARIDEYHIEEPVIIRVNDYKYYLFSEKENIIAVCEGDGTAGITTDAPEKDITIGGWEKNSFGIMIHNPDVLQHAYKYNLTINEQTASYKYNQEKYLVVQDPRIEGLRSGTTIEFLDEQNRLIFRKVF